MWNVFKKVWVKAHGNNAASADACNIGYADGGDVTNGERILFPQRFPRRSSLRMRGSRTKIPDFADSSTHKKRHSCCLDARVRKHDVRDDTTHSDTPSPVVTPRRPLLSETGRSMIEMLGVLAIIGVLSIAGVGGYRWALVKYRTNETMNELNMRALSLSHQLIGGNYSREELNALCEKDLTDGFSEETGLGYRVNAYLGCPGLDYFEIYVEGVGSKECRQLMKDYLTPLCIVAGERGSGTDWEACLIDESQCGSDEEVDMAFIYNNDLVNGERSCPARSEFNPGDYRCHCGGGTYVDKGACECPAGYQWNDDTNACFESLCDEDYFYAPREGKCVPCDDLGLYRDVAESECQKCSNRHLTTLKFCIHKDYCPEGFFNAQGTCFKCTSTHAWYMSDAYLQQRAVEVCPNFKIYEEYAIREDWCPFGTGFLYRITGGAALSCVKCTSSELSYPHLFTAYPACDKCVDDKGQALRKSVVKQNGTTYCIRTTCSSGEFKGADGACYTCDEIDKVAVSAADESGCEACGRVVTEDGYCQKDCTDGMLMKDGRCYTCDYFEKDKALPLSDFADRDECGVTKCSNRDQVNGFCIYPDACPDGVLYLNGAYCYSCNSTINVAVGGVDTPGANQCKEHCGKEVTSRGVCVLHPCATDYVQGDQGTCYECSTVNKINIGTGEIERNKCSACSTVQRFWAGSYCYRCDSAETPNVTTDEEKAQCLSCGAIRQVKDGKCALVTSA